MGPGPYKSGVKWRRGNFWADRPIGAGGYGVAASRRSGLRALGRAWTEELLTQGAGNADHPAPARVLALNTRVSGRS